MTGRPARQRAVAEDWIIAPGDRVLLAYRRGVGIPRRLDHTWATVVVPNERSLDIRLDSGDTRRVSRGTVVACIPPRSTS
jgi:hypothetical protein